MLVNTLSNMIAYLLAIPILLVVLAVYGITLTPALALLPVLLLIQGLLIVGLSLIVATLNVFYRDIQHLVAVALALMFFLTPVFYRSQAVVEQYRAVFALNPLAILINSYRAIFFYGITPTWLSLLYASLFSAITFMTGYTVYRSQQHHIIDFI
jgi:ABC-type polysaccharide/polyol phosphate export permease